MDSILRYRGTVFGINGFVVQSRKVNYLLGESPLIGIKKSRLLSEFVGNYHLYFLKNLIFLQ